MDNPILALIASFLAMVFVVCSYFVRKKSLYLIFQVWCILFLAISYFFECNYFAMLGITCGLARTLTFFIYEQKDKPAPLWLAFVFAGVTVSFYLITNSQAFKPLDLMYLTALVMYAFIFRIRNLKVVRFTMLVPTILSILYNTLVGAAIFTSLTYVFELTANVVSIFRYHIIGDNKSAIHNENIKENTNE